MASLPPPPPNGDFSGAPRTDARAIASLVCGILGVLIVGLILGAVAVILGRRSRREIMEQPTLMKGLGLATAGMVLGVIDMAAYLFIILA